MQLDGELVFGFLKSKGVSHLYHVNTARTSSSFVFTGGLLSRGMVEKNGLVQTKQYTDGLDKKFGIWNDIFLDSDDYHRRIKNRNKYGPVLFELKSEVLLIPGVDLRVTCLNPSKWSMVDIGSSYFKDDDHFISNFKVGTFDYIITLHDFDSVLPFRDYLTKILIDCPFDTDPWEKYSFKFRMHLVNESLRGGSFAIPQEMIQIRDCSAFSCKCSDSYSLLPKNELERLFLYE